MTFSELGLIEPILKALETEGYVTPTPIQQQAIPVVLQGRDLLGCAQTGTGKTAAFAVPIIQLHHQSAPAKGPMRIKTLILTPTRELAIQIGDSFRAYGANTRIRHTVIFGGVGQQPQTDALKRGVEVLIATPGRLLDLMQQGFVHLNDLEVFVLDEADRMLDMGFIHDVRKVITKLPSKRQTLFFSATMPPEIQKLADTILDNPEYVAVTPVSSTAEKVSQAIYFVEKKDKKDLLNHLLGNQEIRAALVFSRTKHGANKIAKELNAVRIGAEAIHGNKSQTARQTALNNFKSGKTRVLVATDIAARGIDIDELAFVVNYDLPNVPETYVHRIGRTGRAGASGQAISFCDTEERPYLRDIEKLIGKKVPVAQIPEDLNLTKVAAPVDQAPVAPKPKPQNQPRPQRDDRNGGGQQGNGQRQPQNGGQSNNQPRPQRDDRNSGGQRQVQNGGQSGNQQRFQRDDRNGGGQQRSEQRPVQNNQPRPQREDRNGGGQRQMQNSPSNNAPNRFQRDDRNGGSQQQPRDGGQRSLQNGTSSNNQSRPQRDDRNGQQNGNRNQARPQNGGRGNQQGGQPFNKNIQQQRPKNQTETASKSMDWDDLDDLFTKW